VNFLTTKYTKYHEKKIMEVALTAVYASYFHDFFFVLLSSIILFLVKDFLKQDTQVSIHEILSHF